MVMAVCFRAYNREAEVLRAGKVFGCSDARTLEKMFGIALPKRADEKIVFA
ncbi:hypothetical protein X772_36475 [Mesorhizobium sp. LSJC280B00]|nr:hypothetical protein X772_36475 [Mesorhizobium sp. LSJC280B00]